MFFGFSRTAENAQSSTNLHASGDRFSVAEDFGQISHAKHVSQGRLSQKAGGVVGVLDVGDTHCRVGHPAGDSIIIDMILFI